METNSNLKKGEKISFLHSISKFFFIVLPFLFYFLFILTINEKEVVMEKIKITEIPKEWKFHEVFIDKINLEYIGSKDSTCISKFKSGNIYYYRHPYMEDNSYTGGLYVGRVYLVFIPNKLENEYLCIYFKEISTDFIDKSNYIEINNLDVFLVKKFEKGPSMKKSFIPLLFIFFSAIIYYVIYFMVSKKFKNGKIKSKKIYSFLEKYFFIRYI